DERAPHRRRGEEAIAHRARRREGEVAEEVAGSCSTTLLFTLLGAPSRRKIASKTSVGASIRTRADFDAAAITPPASPICLPTAIALERSFTARPLHNPAWAGSRPAAIAIG